MPGFGDESGPLVSYVAFLSFDFPHTQIKIDDDERMLPTWRFANMLAEHNWNSNEREDFIICYWEEN